MDCHICQLNAAVENLPFAERLYLDEHWRVAHGWSSLPGWLVVAARRHVDDLAGLSLAEATGLGELLRAASRALTEVVGCERTYLMLFGETPSYRHLHVHVVPRMSWFSDEDRGPATLRYLNVPDETRVPEDERERLARAIGARIESEL